MLKTTRHKLMQNQPKFLLRIDDDQRFAGIYDRKSALNHLKVKLDLHQKFTRPLTTNQLYRYFKKRFTLTAVSHVYSKNDLIWYEPLTAPIDYLAWFSDAINTNGDLHHQQTLTLPTYDRDVSYHNSQRPTSHAGYRRHQRAYCKHKGHFAAYYRYREAVADVDQTLPLRHRHRKTTATFIDQRWLTEFGSRKSYGWKTSTHRKRQSKNRD